MGDIEHTNIVMKAIIFREISEAIGVRSYLGL